MNTSNESPQTQDTSPPNGAGQNPAPVHRVEGSPAAEGKPERKTQTSADKLREISRLIRGEPDVADQAAQSGADEAARLQDGAPPKSNAPRTLDELATRLNVKPEDLYDLEIAFDGAGERRKLGELKDYFAKGDEHQLERLSWAEERDKERAELARARAELNELLAAVPKDKLNTQVLDAARRKYDANVAAERKRTLNKIPAWRDDDKRTLEIAGMAEHLADYGLPPHMLQNIADHRILLYMRDNWLRKTRLDEALQRVNPVRTGTPPAATRSAPTPSKTVRTGAGASRTLDQQVEAVSNLLRR